MQKVRGMTVSCRYIKYRIIFSYFETKLLPDLLGIHELMYQKMVQLWVAILESHMRLD